MMHQNEWRQAFGAPSASFDARVDETLRQIKEDKKVKKISFRAVLIAAVIMLLTMGVVYAAVTGRWNVTDYYEGTYGRHIPEGFTSNYDREITLATGNASLSVRDAFVDGPAVYLLAELSTTDGTPGYFTMADVGPDDEIGQFYLDKDKKSDTRTFTQAAKESGGKVYPVSVQLKIDGAEDTQDSLDFWYEENDVCVLMLTVQEQDIIGKTPAGSLTLSLDDGDTRMENAVPVSFPVRESACKTIKVDQKVEGLPVVVDSLTVTSGSLSNFFSLDWHYDETASDAQTEEMDIWFELLDDALNRLPEGALTACGVYEKGKNSYTQKFESTPADLALDHAILRAYDPMMDGKPRYGSVTVKLK